MEEKDYLILVNKKQELSVAYINKVKFVECVNYANKKCLVEEKTYKAFYSLRDALRKDGIWVELDSGYRSIDQQKKLIEAFIDQYGEHYARYIVAEPGASEHHTGLAIDIVVWSGGKWIIKNDDLLRQIELFEAIFKRLHKFGFILRYPADKEGITGYGYEPWHFRYVGENPATEMYKWKKCLEEYLSRV